MTHPLDAEIEQNICCPQCGHMDSRNVQFCSSCGFQKVSSVKEEIADDCCSACGHIDSSSRNSKYCGQCGVKQEEQEQSDTLEEEEQKQETLEERYVRIVDELYGGSIESETGTIPCPHCNRQIVPVIDNSKIYGVRSRFCTLCLTDIDEYVCNLKKEVERRPVELTAVDIIVGWVVIIVIIVMLLWFFLLLTN